MISSLRSTDVLASRPSQQSARPSRCRPPVSVHPNYEGQNPSYERREEIRVAPIHVSQVNPPMTSPTNGYQTEARPLSPVCQSLLAGRGSVVIKLKAIQKMFHNLSCVLRLCARRSECSYSLSLTPASPKVAISERILQAASAMLMPSAAPVPSPRRRSRSKSGLRLSQSSMTAVTDIPASDAQRSDRGARRGQW